MKLKPALLVLMQCLTLASCATIFTKSTKEVAFNSKPEAAEILVDGQLKGQTPLKLHLKPTKNSVITFRKPGYEDTVITLDTHVSGGWVVLDILSGIIGVAVDAGTGRWRNFNEKEQFAVLIPKSDTKPAGKTTKGVK